jgi:hypothetical protein
MYLSPISPLPSYPALRERGETYLPLSIVAASNFLVVFMS